MISGTVIYDVRPVVNQLFAAPGVTVSIYNADPAQTVWLSTRQSGLKAGLGIPLPPNGLIAWDADKDCYAVSAGPDVLLAVTDNSGALNFQGPTLAQITAAVPTAAANAAASAAAILPSIPTSAQTAAAVKVSALPQTQDRAMFGDGSDGNVTLGAGTTTLLRDMQYANLTVANGATLISNGFRVRASVSINVAVGGAIRNDGSSPGSGAPAGSLARGGDGGDASTPTPIDGLGGRGGASSSAVAGAISTNGPPLPAYPLGQLASAAGLGGGGGGASGSLSLGFAPGGGGGGVVVVSTPALALNGTISAKGGNGGSSSFNSNGGGGGGGVVYLAYRTITGGGSVDVSGGAASTNGTPSQPGYPGNVVVSVPA